MNSTKLGSDVDSRPPSAELADAIDASAAAVADGLAGALCLGLAWTLCGPLVRALMAAARAMAPAPEAAHAAMQSPQQCNERRHVTSLAGRGRAAPPAGSPAAARSEPNG